jgi:cell division protein FtsZ
MEALTVTVISSPAHFEGKSRLDQARIGFEKMKSAADMTILIPLDCLLKLFSPHILFGDFFEEAPKILGKIGKEIYTILKNR